MKKVLICMLQLHKNSGSARTAYENIYFFKEKGYEVHVVAMTMDKVSLQKRGAIPHKVLPWYKSTGLARRKWYNFQVEVIRKRLKPDITIGHGDIVEQDILTLHNSVFLASELIHGKPLSKKNEMAQLHGQILKEKKFKLIVANSFLMKNDLINRFLIDEEKIEVVYPTLDTDVFTPVTEASKRLLRKKFGFPDKIVIALITSGNFKKRGVDNFIKAIHSLPEEIQKKASFRVIGKEDQKEFLDPLIVHDPVMKHIQDYYRAVDLFVLPARIEEFGRVVLEAMGSGIPVITTDKTGASEIIEGESREFIVSSTSTEALAMAMEKLIVSDELRKKIGLINSESALKISKSFLFQRFEAIIAKLCLIPQFICDSCSEFLCVLC